MANSEHLKILLQGVKEWNQWRKENPAIQPDLSEAELNNAELNHAHLSSTNLSKAKLYHANLNSADLTTANLQGADLIEADLRNANLSYADLNQATLVYADLGGATLISTNFNDTDLSAIHYNRSKMAGNYRGVRIAYSYGNAIFKRDAQDQDFIDSMKLQYQFSWWRSLIFKFWGLIDYGRSLSRVALFALFIATVFGFIYMLSPDMLAIRHQEDWWFSPFYYSIVTYTTLGFGDITPATKPGMILVTIEVIFGYLTLGLLVSILANLVARRS
ncbi:pentapeptide repeat-containing protein [candidate division KSB1 bacterium]|nr:pentapeptide repeat-containing protein [candidate division KSB1 bacterium]